MGLMDDANRAAKRSADLAEMSDAKRIERLRAELAAKAKRFDDAVEAIDLKDKELIQERGVSRDLRKRVGELENKNSYNLQIVREATASAERAEAEADSLRNTIDNMRAMNIKLTWEASGRVLAAEAERDALRGALEAGRRRDRPLPEMRCDCCDNGIDDEWDFCPFCGHAHPDAALAPSPANEEPA